MYVRTAVKDGAFRPARTPVSIAPPRQTVVFGIQLAIPGIILSVACPNLQYFPTYLIKGTTFGKSLLNMKYVFWFCVQLLSETFLIVRSKNREFVEQLGYYYLFNGESCTTELAILFAG